ncbi:hypothetical protein [Microvirga terrestris]|uniref:Uncharacterized protein n=1 Tax=Microvirga terrestris TaxID=2791024 RepID=A0ABS0HUS5_9HYPH|nr:hypothetical protein [Microvirga terrestris]MBF9197261.1 hypothetical protein [Microvirga terrestris]
MPKVAEIQLAPNNMQAGGGALPDSYSPPAERWQNLPLFALQSSTDVAAEGEVRLLALQVAFERERNNAAAARLQVAALQEQMASLQEKQEEVLVLREQLADTEAHTRQATGSTIAESEQRRLAEQALLKVTALQEELASLSTQILMAKTTAESEKAKAASALMQLEAVQHQLAIITALQSDRMEADKHLQPNDDHIALDNLRDAHPGQRSSKLPLLPVTTTASSVEQRQTPHRSGRPDKSERAKDSTPRQAPLSIGTKPPARPVDKSAAAPVRAPEPEASRQTTLSHEQRNQSVRFVGKLSQRANQQPRLLTQDAQNRRGPGALSLPNDLLPDSRLW